MERDASPKSSIVPSVAALNYPVRDEVWSIGNAVRQVKECFTGSPILKQGIGIDSDGYHKIIPQGGAQTDW